MPLRAEEKPENAAEGERALRKKADGASAANHLKTAAIGVLSAFRYALFAPPPENSFRAAAKPPLF